MDNTSTAPLAAAPSSARRPFLSARKVAVLLWLPLFLFLGATFFTPLLAMLRMSVQDTELAGAMPHTVQVLQQWDGQVPPSDAIYAAVATDLLAARKDRTGGVIARRLNLEDAGLQSVVNLTVRRLPESVDQPADWRAAFSQLDPAWDGPGIWHALDRSRGPQTDLYLLSGFDLKRGDDGVIHQKPVNEALYVDVLLRTFSIALSATLICLLLALPTAHLLTAVSPATRGLLMMALLLPLWTSVLVRSAAWLVLLQKNGLINQVLMGLGVVSEPLALIYNRTGVLVSLVHVLLPYAVLPIFSSMKSMSPTQMRAASSLGAAPFTAFRRIYLPQILPGISAGGLLVFILALGYYVTPLLLGGPSDQLLPFYIAFNAVQSVNWGLAAALGAILLAATVVLYSAYVRLVGVHRIGLG